LVEKGSESGAVYADHEDEPSLVAVCVEIGTVHEVSEAYECTVVGESNRRAQDLVVVALAAATLSIEVSPGRVFQGKVIAWPSLRSCTGEEGTISREVV